MIWIILALVPLVIWYLFVKPLSYWKNKGVRQSKPWIIVGDSWRLFLGKTCFLKYVNWMYDQGKGGRYFGFYDFSKPSLCIMDPELIKNITIKDFDHFTDRSNLYVEPDVDPLWSNNLLVLRGEKWRHKRSILSPTFTGSKMRIIHKIMAESADDFISYFLAEDKDYFEVEMNQLYSRYASDVIASTAFGIKVDSLREPNNTFYQTGVQLTNTTRLLDILKLLLLKLSPGTWKMLGLTVFNTGRAQYFQNVLLETIKLREEKHIVRPDLINIFMETRKEKKNSDQSSKNGQIMESNGLSDDEITAHALVFFFAGLESVSIALSFGSYELATNKEVQDRLRQEIIETYNKHGKATYEVLNEMKYMDMVVSEVLRKWPPFLTDRNVAKPYTIEPVNKNEVPVVLERNTAIWIPIYRLHRDPQYFPDPEKFNPERFSDENKHKINPYVYMPFGAGPRLCIGKRFALVEIKSLLFNILLNFEIVPSKKTQIPLKIKSPNFQYGADGGFWLGLKRIR